MPEIIISDASEVIIEHIEEHVAIESAPVIEIDLTDCLRGSGVITAAAAANVVGDDTMEKTSGK